MAYAFFEMDNTTPTLQTANSSNTTPTVAPEHRKELTQHLDAFITLYQTRHGKNYMANWVLILISLLLIGQSPKRCGGSNVVISASNHSTASAREPRCARLWFNATLDMSSTSRRVYRIDKELNEGGGTAFNIYNPSIFAHIRYCDEG